MSRHSWYHRTNTAPVKKYDRRTNLRFGSSSPNRRRVDKPAGAIRKLLAWLTGESYDPSVAPRWLKKQARANARAAFKAKCQRRALRPQGCSIPAEVWK